MHHPTLPETTIGTTIEEAKNWMRDCIWRDDEDQDRIDDMDDVTTIQEIDRYYDGGWLQFVRNLAGPDRPKTWLQFVDGAIDRSIDPERIEQWLEQRLIHSM